MKIINITQEVPILKLKNKIIIINLYISWINQILHYFIKVNNVKTIHFYLVSV
jgi:hypothetical protein